MKRFLRTASFFALAAIVAFGAARPAFTDVPNLMHFQGQLTDASTGAPRTGTFSMTFRIYSAASGGSALWTELQTGVQVNSKGFFSVLLGSVTPLGLTFADQYWLSLQINVESEMSTRFPLASSPYSIHAGMATQAEDSLTVNGIGASPAASPQPGQLVALDLTGKFPASVIPGPGGEGVTSLNSLTGALSLVAGSNITITPSGSNITIAASVVGTGDVTDVLAGTGISVANSGGPQPTVSINFSGTGSASTAARSDHNHDSAYASVSHNHNGVYAPVSHNHDASYVKKTGDTMTGNLTLPGLVVGSGADPGYPLVARYVSFDNIPGHANVTLAKTEDMRLVGQGNTNGFQIYNDSSDTREYVIRKNGSAIDVGTIPAGNAKTISMATTDQWLEVMFGNVFDYGHIAEVRLFRRANDYSWAGFLNATVNQ